MIKVKLYYLLLPVLLAGCRSPAKIDLRDYMLPTTDLLQGKVYCYFDSSGAYTQFDYVQETFSGSTTFFETIEYDSSFSEAGEEKDRLNREGIMPVSIELFLNGRGSPALIKSGLIPWIHPLQSETTSLYQRFAMKSGGSLAMASLDGSFDRITDSSLLGRYQAQDCVQENVVLRLDRNNASRPFHSEVRQVYCLSKGIGRIGIASSDGRKQFLKKIISKSEFDSLRSQH